jgi:hypothetical protein
VNVVFQLVDKEIEAMSATKDLNEALRTFDRFIKRIGYGGTIMKLK